MSVEFYKNKSEFIVSDPMAQKIYPVLLAEYIKERPDPEDQTPPTPKRFTIPGFLTIQNFVEITDLRVAPYSVEENKRTLKSNDESTLALKLLNPRMPSVKITFTYTIVY